MQSKEYFDTIAGDWDTMQRAFFSDEVREAAFRLAEVKPHSTAADIGSGTGFITEGLLTHKINVYAVDQSQQMLDLLKQKLQSKGHITCVVADGASIPIPDQQVDYVFANMYLHHTQNPLAAIKEMYRILKQGGRLVITDLDAHNHIFLQTQQHDVWLGFERNTIKQWLTDARFTLAEVTCVGCDCCADSLDSDEAARISIFAALGEK